MHLRRAGCLAVAALLAVALTACGSSGNERPEERPSTFALGLGVDLDDPDALATLGRYDLVVVDGEGATAAQVEELQDDGATVLAYLSAGTLEPGRPWFDEAEREGWLLDHWDDWNEWYAAVDQVRLRDLLVGVASDQLAKGFDGLFLDNTDMVQAHPEQEDGMRELVAAFDRLVGSDRLLFAQNGDPAAAGVVGHLDGWNREDVSFTYDFDAEAYRRVSPEDHAAAIEQLEDLRDRGLVTTATDYLASSTGEQAGAATRAACDAGARSYVSDIGLTRVPDPPTTCPDR